MTVAPGGLALMAALLFGSGDQRSGLSAERRSRMQRSGATQTGHSAAGRTTQTGAAHHRLPGTNGAAVNWLAGNGRRTAGRHSGARRLRSLPGRGTSLLQTRHHIGTRGHYRPRSGLSGEIRARLRTQGRSWNSSRSRRRLTGRDGSSGNGRRRQSNGSGRHRGWRRSGRSGRRQGLTRSGENLSGARRRRSRSGWYRSSTQGRMHGSTSASRKGRPYRRRFHS